MQSVVLGGGASAPATLKMIDILRYLGLDTNLLLCLDAGDAASYSGTGHTWADVSGSGNDFLKTATGVTFTGTAGSLGSGCYFSNIDTAGAGHYIYNFTSSAFDNFHKSGGKCTIALIIRHQVATGVQSLWYNGIDSDARGDNGVHLYADGADEVEVVYDASNANNSAISYNPATSAMSDNTDHMIGCGVDDAALLVKAFLDSNAFSTTKTASTNTGTPNSGVLIGVDSEISSPVETTTRFYGVMCWDRLLSDAEWSALYAQMKLRFTALP